MDNNKLKTLKDKSTDENLLSPALRKFYGGPLGFPEPPNNSPYVLANFVTSMDGRISFDQPGALGGGEISMFHTPDRMLMAVLRTLAGGVLMGANTLRLEPNHIWTARFLLPDQPEFLRDCDQLRSELGLSGPMPHYFLTRTGSVLPKGGKLPAALTSEEASICFLTTTRGAKQLETEMPSHVKYTAETFGDETVDLQAALKFIREQGVKNLLCEGGPTVIGDLVRAALLHEVFLTEAPHVIGSSYEPGSPDRKTWVAGYHAKHGESAQFDWMSLKIHGGHIFKRFRSLTVK